MAVAYQHPSDEEPADQRGEVRVRRVYEAALMLRHAASKPTASEGGATWRRWPGMLGEGRWPAVFAWIITGAEMLGGLCLLVGLGTRFWSGSLLVVVLGMLWLTEIGPAMQSGKTVLGVLPAYPLWNASPSPHGYQTILWQLLLAWSLMLLVAQGAGRCAIDSMLLAPPKPAPKPKPAGV